MFQKKTCQTENEVLSSNVKSVTDDGKNKASSTELSVAEKQISYSEFRSKVMTVEEIEKKWCPNREELVKNGKKLLGIIKKGDKKNNQGLHENSKKVTFSEEDQRNRYKNLNCYSYDKNSLASLWVKLLKFYGFNFDTTVIQIHQKEPLLKKDKGWTGTLYKYAVVG